VARRPQLDDPEVIYYKERSGPQNTHGDPRDVKNLALDAHYGEVKWPVSNPPFQKS